ncbi:hypothetical protein KC320_g1384 [Hortaea werneckii]|nr:hypothetical protein KC320_g1384 [Hortaea werneckii]
MTTCILLVGAPELDGLIWDERHLLNWFEPPIQRFLGREASLSSTADGDASTLAIPKWRSIPFNLNNSTALHTNRDQETSQQGTQFLSFLHDASTTHDASHEQDHLAFLEQSLARLDELESSQITPMLEDETTTTFNSNLDDSLTGEEGTPDLSNSQGTESRATAATLPQHPQTQQHQPFRIIGPISDLRSIPSAAHIDSIFPGTMTLNLLCAVISVSPLRTVQLRRRQRAGITGNPQHPNTASAVNYAAHPEERELLEVLLGDETRAGFSATFWFLPEPQSDRHFASHTADRRGGAAGGGRPNVWDANEDSKHRRWNLLSLRPGDVVLIRNLALSVFKGGVYGQSLRGTGGKAGLGRGNFTDVRVLEEEESGEGFLSLLPPSMRGQVLGKLSRVRDWRDGFVGPGVRVQDGRGGREDVGGRMREREWLPADTQSPVK